MASLKKDFLWRSVQIWAKEGSVFALFLLAVFLLSPENFGLYSYVSGFAYLFVLLGDFGVSATVAKMSAEAREEGKEELGRVFWSGLAATLAFTLVALVALWGIAEFFLGEYAYLALYTVPAVILSPFASLFDGYHRGLQEFKRLSIVSAVAAVSFILASLYLIPIYDLKGALIAQTAYFAAFILAAIVLPRMAVCRIEYSHIRTVLKYSLIVGIGTIGYYFYAKVGSVVLGRAGYILEAGQYELAARFLGIAVIAFSVFGQVLGPKLVALRSDRTKLWEAVRTYRKRAAALALLASIALSALIAGGVWLFLPAYWTTTFITVLLVLAATLPFDLWAVIQRQGILVPLGYARAMTYGTIGGGVVLLALSVLFVFLMGAVGVAVAALLARAATTLLQDWYLSRELRAAQ